MQKDNYWGRKHQWHMICICVTNHDDYLRFETAPREVPLSGSVVVSPRSEFGVNMFEFSACLDKVP